MDIFKSNILFRKEEFKLEESTLKVDKSRIRNKGQMKKKNRMRQKRKRRWKNRKRRKIMKRKISRSGLNYDDDQHRWNNRKGRKIAKRKHTYRYKNHLRSGQNYVDEGQDIFGTSGNISNIHHDDKEISKNEEWYYYHI